MKRVERHCRIILLLCVWAKLWLRVEASSSKEALRAGDLQIKLQVTMSEDSSGASSRPPWLSGGRLLELQPNQGCCNILSWTSELWMADQTILFADHFIPAEAEHLNQNEATIEVSDTTQDYIGPWNGWLNPASLIVLFLKYAWNYRPRTTDKVHLKQTLVSTRWQYVWSKFLIYIQLKCYKWHPFLRCGQGCLCQNSNRNSLHCAQNRSSTKHTVSSYFRTYLKVDMESYFDKWRSFVSSQHAKYSSLIR